MKASDQLLDDGQYFLNRQRIFVRYTYAILIDLTVLNLFNEYWDKVYIYDFTTSLFTAVLLQVLLQLTLIIEHKVAEYLQKKSGKNSKFLRGFSTWAILFISKLLILEAIDYFFGDKVLFHGAYHGLIAFIVVVLVIVIAEKSVGWVYRKLGEKK